MAQNQRDRIEAPRASTYTYRPPAEEQFRDAIQAAGITPPVVIVADDDFHRFPTNGSRSDDAGSYVLHADGIPIGYFKDWRTGISGYWRANTGRSLTWEEKLAHRSRVRDTQHARESEKVQGQAEAASKAEIIWNRAQPASVDHPYLARKGIEPHGTRVDADGMLLVPMFDSKGKLWNLERVAPEKPGDGKSDKKGLPRGRRTGCFFPLGDTACAAVLCIAEGFATAASLHEATGYPVVAAFNAGNLPAVAKTLREKFPSLRIILCADDDYRTEGNPGLTNATEAARSVGGLLAVPDFGPARPEKATDFNDLHQLAGLEVVRGCIAETLERSREQTGTAFSPGVSGVSGVQARGEGLSADTPPDRREVSEVAEAGEPSGTEPSPGNRNPFPGEEERPSYVILDDSIEFAGRRYRSGVYHCTTERSRDGEVILAETWFCSPLHVEAVTFDSQYNNFGRLLRFKNSLGTWREWAMPMELLRGSGEELRGELLAMGVELDPFKARQQLPAYLQRESPERRMHCALQVGWCGNSYVLPDRVVGPSSADVIFQSGERGQEEYTQAGALEGWQDEVASRAIGNPLMLLALSASFAGPLLAKCNADSGGIHLYGDSSTGKTTFLEAACSVWGGPNYRRSWRATANGMEGAAALFNDGLLALDEIGECDPRDVGTIVYALGNGRGKQRATRSGAARGVTRWRSVILSTGERTLATTMQEGGFRAKAGQSVRLLDIPVARTFGAFDVLHDMASGAPLADAIKRGAATHYGQAGPTFLEKLTCDPRDFCATLEKIKALPEFAAGHTEGQDKRAAARFALIALAGELATEYGITGWTSGDAIMAAAEGFRLWQSARGRGNDERRQILEQVSGFIERHGDGRFSDVAATVEMPVRDRAGWWRDSDGERVYLFTAAGMREVLKGFDFRRALDVLVEAGVLPPAGADGKRGTFHRIGGRGIRLYPVQAAQLGEGHDAG